MFDWDFMFDPPSEPRRTYGCKDCEGFGCDFCHICEEFNEECQLCIDIREDRIEKGEECRIHGTSYMDKKICLECEYEKAQANKKMEDDSK